MAWFVGYQCLHLTPMCIFSTPIFNCRLEISKNYTVCTTETICESLPSGTRLAECLCFDTDRQAATCLQSFLGNCMRSVSNDVNEKLLRSKHCGWLQAYISIWNVVVDFFVYRIVSLRLELSWKRLEIQACWRVKKRVEGVSPFIHVCGLIQIYIP